MSCVAFHKAGRAVAQGVECKSINPGIGVDHQMAHRKNGTDLRAVWLGRGPTVGELGLGHLT